MLKKEIIIKFKHLIHRIYDIWCFIKLHHPSQRIVKTPLSNHITLNLMHPLSLLDRVVRTLRTMVAVRPLGATVYTKYVDPAQNTANVVPRNISAGIA